MKVFILFVLVFCVDSSFQQLNRQQNQISSLTYSEADFNPLPPVIKTTTTTQAPDTTTKKKGFFSGISGFFGGGKSKDKESTSTTTTQAPTTTKKSLSAVTSTTTVKSTNVVTTTTLKSVQPPQIPPRSDSLPNAPKIPPRPDSPTQSTPKVPPRSALSTPPPRPTSQQLTTTTIRPKTTKDDFPPLPTQSTPKPNPSIHQQPTASSAIPNAWGKPPSGPTPKPQSFSLQSVTSSTQKTVQAPMSVSNGPVTDAELLTLSNSLFSKDISNPFKYVTVNYQGKLNFHSTAQTDEAPQALLKIDDKLFTLTTVEKMKVMYNNYEQDAAINEYVSPIEKKEEDEFVDAVLTTPVMRHAMSFLAQKGVVTSDPQTHRELLKTIWFGLYSRGQGKIGSSGFEHIFLSEVKNGTVMGLHNWIYLNEAEKSGDLDYKGWTKKIDLGNKGQIAKIRFSLNGLDKPTNSLFIGTSPELELALYTVCFELRADKDCRLAYGGKDFNIVTHSYRYRGKNLIGSAYPEI